MSGIGRIGAEPSTKRSKRFRSRVNPCGICGGISGAGAGFPPSNSVFPVNIVPTILQTYLYHDNHLTGGTNGWNLEASKHNNAPTCIAKPRTGKYFRLMFQTVQMCRLLVSAFHCAGPAAIPGRIYVRVLMRKKQNQYGLPPSTSVLPCQYQ